MAGLTATLSTVSLKAHLVTTGLGPIYDGITHLFLSPEDLLPLLALSLFAGLRGAPSSRSVLFIVPVAWLIGGLFGLYLHSTINPAWATLSLLRCGAIVAMDLRLSRQWIAGLAVALGVFHGFLNGVSLEEARLGVQGLLGIAAAAFVFIALVSSFSVPLKTAWTRIAVRVIGSWVVAIGLLMLGWSFRGE